MLNNYLERLNKVLSVLEPEERNNIMDFVEEMINDRIEIGQSEQEILESLGEPEEFAKNFIGNEEFKKIENKATQLIDKHLEFENVQKLDIESISYSYVIQSTTGNKLTVDYEDSADSSLNITMRNGTLSIEQDPMNQFDFSNMFRKWSERKWVALDVFFAKYIWRWEKLFLFGIYSRKDTFSVFSSGSSTVFQLCDRIYAKVNKW